MKYLVQAILIDNAGNNTIETVIDSFRLEKGEAFEIFFDTDHNIILKKY